MELQSLTKVSMISRVVRMGSRRLIIEVPREFHDKVNPLIGKQVRVDLTEALWDGDSNNNNAPITDRRIEDKFIAKVSKEVGENLTHSHRKRGRK